MKIIIKYWVASIDTLRSTSLVRSTEKSLNDVRSQVKSAYQSSSAITDIDVTFDGTWLTRGHSSQIGVGCVINLLTGLVKDFEIIYVETLHSM
ncbi:uncharacterized protein TNCV_3249621 [Trichonephila clavipes]|nr:uncharacterized protein TNCV_3249621 [Trichonephila clavipes]